VRAVGTQRRTLGSAVWDGQSRTVGRSVPHHGTLRPAPWDARSRTVGRSVPHRGTLRPAPWDAPSRTLGRSVPHRGTLRPAPWDAPSRTVGRSVPHHGTLGPAPWDARSRTVGRSVPHRGTLGPAPWNARSRTVERAVPHHGTGGPTSWDGRSYIAWGARAQCGSGSHAVRAACPECSPPDSNGEDRVICSAADRIPCARAGERATAFCRRSVAVMGAGSGRPNGLNVRILRCSRPERWRPRRLARRRPRRRMRGLRKLVLTATVECFGGSAARRPPSQSAGTPALRTRRLCNAYVKAIGQVGPRTSALP
jgi:hypothetical protein